MTAAERERGAAEWLDALWQPGWRKVEGRWGPCVVLARDQYIGRSLIHYGEFSPDEVTFLRGLMRPGDLVVDAGANIGALAIPLALAGARVLAVEPQPELFDLLLLNVQLAGVADRVACHNVALGAEPGTLWLPALDYDQQNNFGGVPLFPTEAAIARDCHGMAGRPVPATTLDLLLEDQGAPALVKADVEGMEPEVLLGAARTLSTRPTLYLEADRPERRGELEQLLRRAGYGWQEHKPLLYSRRNYFANPIDLFPRIVSLNLFARPKARTT